MLLRTTTIALLVLRAARAHDCGATAGARSAALVKGAAALRACLPLLEAAESRRREGHK